MRLNRSFFERNPAIVAKELLGKIIVRKTDRGTIKGVIIETEAYGDADDLASHARFGITPRNRIMYGEPGKLYVYLNYGIFNLTNIICEEKDKPGAVLLRSAEIIDGSDLSKELLDKSKFVKANEFLATGPGKLSVAFGIDRKLNSEDIVKSDDVYIEYPKREIDFDIIESERVGVDYASHSKAWPWRFHIKGNQFVSHK